MKLMSVDIDWLGHAGFKIKSKDLVVYVDPFVLPPGCEKADLILVTHEHFDHCDKEKIKQLIKDNTVIVCPVSCNLKLKSLGVEIRVMSNNQRIEIKGVSVESVPAYNINKFKSQGEVFHPRGEGNGYVFTINGTVIYHASDTDFIPEMKDLKNVDVALLPIGGVFTMDESEAVEAVKAIQPRYVIPMHYGTLKETVADARGFKSMVEVADLKTRVILLG